MSKVFCAIINYKYGDFLLRNFDAWVEAQGNFSGMVVIDDQSRTINDDKALSAFSSSLCPTLSTIGPKSKDNSINQLNAIRCALNFFEMDDNDYLWVVDADDCPVSPPKAVGGMLFEPRGDIHAVPALHTGQENFTRVEPIIGQFWIRRATTSQLLVKKSTLEKFRSSIFDPSQRDLWYDARIVSLPFQRKTIGDIASVRREIHSESDSARYRENKVKKIYRAIKTLKYKSRLTINLIMALAARPSGRNL